MIDSLPNHKVVDNSTLHAMCAEAMGFRAAVRDGMNVWLLPDGGLMLRSHYMPLADNAQVMELVKRFGLTLTYVDGQGRDEWHCTLTGPSPTIFIVDKDLNRAVVRAVAEKQARQVY